MKRFDKPRTGRPVGRPVETVEKVAAPLFREGLHESFSSISSEIVGKSFVRSVIFEVHAPGNDGIQFYSVAFGRRNSLQEGFFDKLNRASCGTPSSIFSCPVPQVPAVSMKISPSALALLPISLYTGSIRCTPVRTAPPGR